MQPKLFFSNEPLKPTSQLLLFLHVVSMVDKDLRGKKSRTPQNLQTLKD